MKKLHKLIRRSQETGRIAGPIAMGLLAVVIATVHDYHRFV